MPGDGPIPKRSDQRRRRNKPEAGATIAKAATSPVAPTWAPPDDAWHPIAQDWYSSLADSGQAQFYEPSDIATARYVAHAMSTNLSTGRFSAQLFAAVMSAMTELLTTEGARRRARIELERNPEPEVPASVKIMADYRAAAGS